MGKPLTSNELLWFPERMKAKEKTPAKVTKTITDTRERTADVMVVHPEEIDARRDAKNMPLKHRVVLLDEMERALPHRYPYFKPSEKAKKILKDYTRQHRYEKMEALRYQEWLMGYVLKWNQRYQEKDKKKMESYDQEKQAGLKEWFLFEDVKKLTGKDRLQKNAQLISEQLKSDPKIRQRVLYLLHNYFHQDNPKPLKKVDNTRAKKAKQIVERLLIGHDDVRKDKLALYVYRRLRLENRKKRERKMARIKKRSAKKAA